MEYQPEAWINYSGTWKVSGGINNEAHHLEAEKVEGVAKRFPLRLKIVTGVRKDNNAGLGPRGRSPSSSRQNIPKLGINKMFVYYKYIYMKTTKYSNIGG